MTELTKEQALDGLNELLFKPLFEVDGLIYMGRFPAKDMFGKEVCCDKGVFAKGKGDGTWLVGCMSCQKKSVMKAVTEKTDG